MLVREENTEYISRIIGDFYTGGPLVEKLIKMGVPREIVVYPNTKWRMVFDVMNYYSILDDQAKALKMLSKIIELVIHPLNFSVDNFKNSTKIIVDLNKRLAFDKLLIKENDGEFNLVKISAQSETKTSTDYITEVINYFKDEYNKIRLTGLTYEYKLGMNFAMSDYEPKDGEIDESFYRNNAIEQLYRIGFVTSFEIDHRVVDDYGTTYDYTICTIDESRLTQKEEPIATETNVQKIVHEHTHRFENSIQEKPIDLKHIYSKESSKGFYITKDEGDFRYKGKLLNLQRDNNYYKIFTVLYSYLPEGGEIRYGDLIKGLADSISEIKSMTKQKAQKLIQSNLTDKSNGFARHAKLPIIEDNGKPLIEIIHGSGVRFNNRI